MKRFLIPGILLFSSILFSCKKDGKPTVNNTQQPQQKQLEGTWKYDYMDNEIYDSTGKYESKYDQNLMGLTLDLKEDKTYNFTNPAKPENNKSGSWQAIDSTKLVLDKDTFSIQLFTLNKLTYKSTFINFIEKPGHLGPNDKPVPKKRIEIYYLSK